VGRGQPGELGSTPSAHSNFRASSVRCTELARQLRTGFNSLSRPPFTQTPQGTAARPNVGRNDKVIPYAGVAVARPKAAVCRWTGSESAPVCCIGSAAEHLTQPNRPSKPDSSLPKISPKCCPHSAFPTISPICNLTSYTHPRQSVPVSQSRRVEPDEIYGVATQLPKATRHQKQSDDRQFLPAGVNPQLVRNPVTAEIHPRLPHQRYASGYPAGVASKG